jgi:plasmid stabilization system protein ParE
MKLEFSPQAYVDLADILEFIGRDNAKAALKLIENIEATCFRLSQIRQAGTDCSELYPRLRAFSHGNYVIYSLAIENRVLRIVRIMHGARDVKPDDFANA